MTHSLNAKVIQRDRMHEYLFWVEEASLSQCRCHNVGWPMVSGRIDLLWADMGFHWQERRPASSRCGCCSCKGWHHCHHSGVACSLCHRKYWSERPCWRLCDAVHTVESVLHYEEDALSAWRLSNVSYHEWIKTELSHTGFQCGVLCPYRVFQIMHTSLPWKCCPKTRRSSALLLQPE